MLLDCGASFGEGYGPIVISSHPIARRTISRGAKSPIPGELTTSYLTLKLFEPNVETVAMPFDKILDAVLAKEVEAGLLIHEGQLMFPQHGTASSVVDLGLWWQERPGCRCRSAETRFARSLGPEVGNQVSRE